VPLLAAALFACHTQTDHGIAGANASDSAPQEPAQVTDRSTKPAVATRERRFLVSPEGVPPGDKMAEAVRKTGYPCANVTSFKELRQDARETHIYKLDCVSYSYQVTVAEGEAYVWPWTGNVFGY
jgi:hypothetical protein